MTLSVCTFGSISLARIFTEIFGNQFYVSIIHIVIIHFFTPFVGEPKWLLVITNPLIWVSIFVFFFLYTVARPSFRFSVISLSYRQARCRYSSTRAPSFAASDVDLGMVVTSINGNLCAAARFCSFCARFCASHSVSVKSVDS